MRFAALVLVVLAACSSSRAPATPLTDVGGSLEAVRAEFDAHAGEPRFIALLSPT